MRLIIIILLSLLFHGVNCSAQYNYFNSQSNWSANKQEAIFGFGATQFTGDLGGSPNIGKDYSIRDINLKSTGFAGMIGFRMRFHPFFATTTTVSFFQLKGDDQLSSNLIRNSRNLNFKSNTLEVQQRLEYIFYSVERVGARYNVSVRQQPKGQNQQYYVFSGVGIMNINPKGLYNGQWYKLRPLRTEGQGLAGGADPYKTYTVTIPFGVGLRFGINRFWRIGLEASYVKTFSDYIDDVSGIYYDPNNLQSSLAVHFANPANQNANWFVPGQQRGDSKQNDAYYHINVVLSRNITYENFRFRLKHRKIFTTNKNKLRRFNG